MDDEDRGRAVLREELCDLRVVEDAARGVAAVAEGENDPVRGKGLEPLQEGLDDHVREDLERHAPREPRGDGIEVATRADTGHRRVVHDDDRSRPGAEPERGLQRSRDVQVLRDARDAGEPGASPASSR